jgi:hypothetical protein
MPKQPDPTKAVLRTLKTAIKGINKEMAIHFSYLQRLMDAEEKRTDANRSGDMTATSLANERTINQAAVLAKQVDNSAQVLAAQLQAMENKINDKITLIQQAQYESKGKTAVINPIVGWIIVLIIGLIIAAVGLMRK